MINSVMHHMGIGLNKPRKAEVFFDELFVRILGLKKEKTWESIAGWKGRGTRFYLYPIKAGKAPGSLQHLAFTARSRQEVDACYRWAIRNGYKTIDTPKKHPQYGGDYYAFFFRGPEDIKLEFVCLTEKDKAKPL